MDKLLWGAIVPLVISVAAGAASGWFATRLQSRQESRSRRQKAAIWRPLAELGSSGVMSADDLFERLRTEFKSRAEFDAVMFEMQRDGLVAYDPAFRSYHVSGPDAHNPYL